MRDPSRRDVIRGIGSSALASVALPAHAAVAAPKLIVDHPRALDDQVLAIRIEGVQPGQRIELVAEKFERGAVTWRSQASFLAGDDGAVDLARDAPASGSYSGADPMGFLWSMTRQAGRSADIKDGIRLGVGGPAVTPVSAMIERRERNDGVRVEAVKERGLVGTLFRPPGDAPCPAVITLGGSGGGMDLAKAALLASHGYAALALAYFRAPGLPDGLVNIPLEYFGTAIDWLRAKVKPRNDFVAVVGTSRGGELALLLGATFTWIDAIVGYVPSGVMIGPFGPSEPGDTRVRAGWTWQGKPLPHLFEQATGTFANAIRNKDAVERASIPVERIEAPVLMISGRSDEIWPSFDLTEIAMRRLERRASTKPFYHLAYEDAGHLIRSPYVPTTVRSLAHPVTGRYLAYGGTAAGDARANADSWPKVLAFLAEASEGPR